MGQLTDKEASIEKLCRFSTRSGGRLSCRYGLILGDVRQSKNYSMLKPKDSLQAEQKQRLKKIDQYPIVHDPRRLSLQVKDLSEYFSRLSDQELDYRVRQVVQNNTKYAFPRENNKLNERILPLSLEEIHQLNSLGLANVKDFEKIARLLTEDDREMMFDWARLSLNKISYFKKENELIRILPKSFFNPLTAWFVDEAYLDLDNSVRFLTEHLSDSREIEEKIYLLMLLGHLHGKFTQPESIQYKLFFRQFIHRDSPGILRELVKIQDDERPEFEKKQERLQKLKAYWHAVFVQSWMAKAKLQYDGRKALSQADQIIGQQDLGMDMRPSDTIRGAESFGMSMEMRLPGREGESQRQADMHMAEELRMERKARESKWNAQHYMNEVLRLYNIDHTIQHRSHNIGQ